MEPAIERKKQLEGWLQAVLGEQMTAYYPLQADASFRRYYRVQMPSMTYIAMDAPPPEQVKGFVAIAQALRALGLQAPDIIASDVSQGFLLLTDFGNRTYLNTLNVNNADYLYETALSALSVLQACRGAPGHLIPAFTAEFMLREWAWHKEWFLQKWLGITLGATEKPLDQIYRLVAQSVASQPQVFMHRDYHAANLMVLPNDEVGILDFQDAFIGPVTYDVVSLLRDCYVVWPAPNVQDWVLLYWQMLQGTEVILGVTQQMFLRWFDWMGVQRHLKALLTFARKAERDGDTRYLQYIPRTLNYLLEESAGYAELAGLHDYYQTIVLPAVMKKLEK